MAPDFREKNLGDIEKQALQLDADERAQLVDVLLETLHETNPGIELSWRHEIAERAAAYDRGELSTYTAQEVFAEANRIDK